MATRFTLARVGAAVLGAAAALTLSALPATAANGSSTTANPDPHGDKYSGSVWLKGDKHEPTTLIALKPKGGGADILTYCVEISVNEGGPSVDMVQVPWTDYPDQKADFNTNRDEINWILHNSFPTLNVDDLSKAAGTPTTLTKQEAVEGTQAAIWHDSDGVDLDTSKNNANVDALYNYLVGNQQKLPQPATDASVTITSPSNTSTEAGGRIGPFVVKTNMQSLQLTADVPSGVTVQAVDSSGKAVDANHITDGTKVYFVTKSDAAAGHGSFTLTGDAQLGQLFVGKDVSDSIKQAGRLTKNCKHSYQSLIVAKSVTVPATAKASWTVETVPSSSSTPTASTSPSTTPAPVVGAAGGTGQLPYTGVNILWPVALAVVLIGGGGAFLLLQKRRKRA
jgi:TQXA domain-containing protein/LPXTG-motif cell wall-anchored protein